MLSREVSKALQSYFNLVCIMVFEDFCSNTSLHGWRFVPMTKHPVGRTLWAFIAVSSIGVAGLFIHTAVKDFFSATGNVLLRLE